MSRLYDRVLAHGCKPLRIDAVVPRSVIEEEREPDSQGVISIPVAQETVQRSEIQGVPVIVLDEAAEYVAGLTVDGDQIRDTPKDVLHSFYGVIRPSFDRCLLEFRGRYWGGGRDCSIGWVVEVEDAGPAPDDTPDWLRDVKWFLNMTLLIEVRPREILGPYMRHVIPLNGYGEPLHEPGLGPRISEHLPSFIPEPTQGESLYMRGIALYLAWPAVFGLSLMNCKNVDMRQVGPPEKLSRKHARQRGTPLTSYYVLDIKPMRRILDAEGEAQTKGLQHALHICRGHFKTYAPEAPLFGRRVGTYWWDAQVRGKAEEGVIEKDYRIRLDQGLGREYVEADEHVEIKPDAHEHNGLDPDLGGRGLRAHNLTQNLLASVVEQAGHVPRRPRPDEPQYDLAWEADEIVWVAEIKSITPQNEERQLRLAVGQVVRYRQLLAAERRVVRAMVAVEREPSDPTWADLCAQEAIALVWPGNMGVLTSSA